MDHTRTMSKGSLSAAATVPALDESLAWAVWLRVFFRFGFSYLIVYLSYTLIDHAEFPIPWIGHPYVKLWNEIAAWVGVHMFHFSPQDVAGVTGGSDTLLEYIQLLCFGVGATGPRLQYRLGDECSCCIPHGIATLCPRRVLPSLE